MDKEKIINEFKRIKSLNYIKSNRQHNTGIGKTFEDYLGVKENNLIDSDFAGFEVKSKRISSSSYLTLFTKSPSGPKGANKFLRDNFGEFYEEYPHLKKLHTSIFSNRMNVHVNKRKFKIKIDEAEKKLIIEVYDMNNVLIDDSVFWTFQQLERNLMKKLKK